MSNDDIRRIEQIESRNHGSGMRTGADRRGFGDATLPSDSTSPMPASLRDLREK